MVEGCRMSFSALSGNDALRDGWGDEHVFGSAGLDSERETVERESARAAQDAAIQAGSGASPRLVTLADRDAGLISRASTGAASSPLPPGAEPPVQKHPLGVLA
jgi:hypothetical protein